MNFAGDANDILHCEFTINSHFVRASYKTFKIAHPYARKKLSKKIVENSESYLNLVKKCLLFDEHYTISMGVHRKEKTFLNLAFFSPPHKKQERLKICIYNITSL